MAAQPKLIALNVGLAAGLALIAWQGRVRWNEARAERRASLNVPVKRVAPPALVPAQKPPTVQAAAYADVAAKNLFSKDRNPTVIVDPPKVEAPKPMPALPVVYGALGLPSGVKAIMAERSGAASKSVRVGDSVGDFKVVALDLQKVTFEWEGKQIEKSLNDLVDRTGGVTPGAPAGPAAPPAAPVSAPAVGPQTGTPDAPTRACVATDTSPPGTVIDGYKKTGVNTPFGVMGCTWVKDK
jgi:hypothetical protein